MAAGEVRAAYSMTEPHAGSDVQAIRTRAVRDGDGWVISGQKMWVTNGLRAGIVMLLAVTDPQAEPAPPRDEAFIVEKEPGVAEHPGLTSRPPRAQARLQGRGVDRARCSTGFRRRRRRAARRRRGGARRRASSSSWPRSSSAGSTSRHAALGVATAAFERAIRYAQQREAFGKPIAEHQLIQQKLAQMATHAAAPPSC